MIKNNSVMYIKPNFKRYVAGVDDAVLAAGISAAGGLAAAGTSAVGQANLNKKNRKFAEEQAEKQRQYSTEMWNKQNDWNLQMWNKTNEYNSPSAQLERLRDSGLNPLYYGLDGTSANGLESAQALGYEQAKSQPQVNPLGAGLDAFMQARGLENSTKLINAQIDKIEEERNSLRLDNQWKEDTMAARVEATEIANSLNKEQLGKIKDERKNIQQELQKLVEETKNESLKGMLIQAQTNVAKMQEKEIAELLPYKKLLMEAQTEAQKAAASASFAKAAIDRGLLEGGYVDKMLEGLDLDNEAKKAGVRASEANAALQEFRAAIRSGNTFALPEGKVGKVVATILNSLFQDLSILGEAVTGPIANVLK